jgi:Tubulin binding cofactor C
MMDSLRRHHPEHNDYRNSASPSPSPSSSSVAASVATPLTAAAATAASNPNDTFASFATTATATATATTPHVQQHTNPTQTVNNIAVHAPPKQGAFQLWPRPELFCALASHYDLLGLCSSEAPGLVKLMYELVMAGNEHDTQKSSPNPANTSSSAAHPSSSPSPSPSSPSSPPVTVATDSVEPTTHGVNSEAEPQLVRSEMKISTWLKVAPKLLPCSLATARIVFDMFVLLHPVNRVFVASIEAMDTPALAEDDASGNGGAFVEEEQAPVSLRARRCFQQCQVDLAEFMAFLYVLKHMFTIANEYKDNARPIQSFESLVACSTLPESARVAEFVQLHSFELVCMLRDPWKQLKGYNSAAPNHEHCDTLVPLGDPHVELSRVEFNRLAVFFDIADPFNTFVHDRLSRNMSMDFHADHALVSVLSAASMILRPHPRQPAQAGDAFHSSLLQPPTVVHSDSNNSLATSSQSDGSSGGDVGLLSDVDNHNEHLSDSSISSVPFAGATVSPPTVDPDGNKVSPSVSTTSMGSMTSSVLGDGMITAPHSERAYYPSPMSPDFASFTPLWKAYTNDERPVRSVSAWIMSASRPLQNQLEEMQRCSPVELICTRGGTDRPVPALPIANIVDSAVVYSSQELRNGDIRIHECHGSSIYLNGTTRIVQVTQCTDCRLNLGLTVAAVIVRNCENLVIQTVCHQLYVIDSSGLSVYVQCTKQPVFIGSTDVLRRNDLAPYNTFYPTLERDITVNHLKHLLRPAPTGQEDGIVSDAKEGVASVRRGTDRTDVHRSLSFHCVQLPAGNQHALTTQEWCNPWILTPNPVGLSNVIPDAFLVAVQLLPVEDYFPTSYPFPHQGPTDCNPIPIPRAYHDALQLRKNQTLQLRKQIDQTPLSDQQRAAVQNVISDQFKQWLHQTGRMDHLNVISRATGRTDINLG